MYRYTPHTPHTIVCQALVATLLLMKHATGAASDTLPEAYPGYNGEYPGFSLVLDERFDRLNQEIWAIGDGAVGTESACRFQDNGVRVAEGTLTLIIDEIHVASGWSEDHQKSKKAYDYVCGELRTRPELRLRYGRIEARMRAPAREVASGYISSLFTYVNEGNAQFDREWEEIDIELEGERPDKFQANLIYGVDEWSEGWGETREFGAWEDKIAIGPVDRWRVFAIEWLPDSIRWFVDGELVKTLTARDLDCDPACVPPQQQPTPIPDTPAPVMMNFWIPNDDIQDVFGGNKRNNRYPMEAHYDWLRIYEYDAAPLHNWSAYKAGGTVSAPATRRDDR
jgi:beta-glucanase (GH16 family)